MKPSSPGPIAILVGLSSFFLLSACGFLPERQEPDPPDPPPPPRYEISNEDLQQMRQEMFGKTPVNSAPVSEDGVQVIVQQGHTGMIQAIAMSPDGRYVVTGGMDETAKVWDVASGQELHSFSGFGMMGPQTVTFSSDSQRVIVADRETVKVYETESGQEIHTLTPFIIQYLTISPDGKFFAASGQNIQNSDSAQTTGIWDLATGEAQSIPKGLKNTIPLAFSADHEHLVIQREEEGELELWNLPSQKLVSNMGDGPEVFKAALSADHRLLAIQDLNDGTISMYNTQTTKKMYETPHPNTENFLSPSLTFNPDGDLLGISSYDNSIHLLEARTGKENKRLVGMAMAFTDSGQQILIGERLGGAPKIVDLQSQQETRLGSGSSAIQDLALSADGKTLLAGMLDGSAKVWNLTTGQITKVFQGPPLGSASITPDGKLVVMGGMQGEVSVWDVQTGQMVKRIAEKQTSEWQAAIVRFAPDGKSLAVGFDETATVFDAKTWKPLWKESIPLKSLSLTSFITPESDYPQGIQQMTYSPNGHDLAISTAGFAGVWNAKTGEERFNLEGKGMTGLMMESMLDSFIGSSSSREPAAQNPMDMYSQVMGIKNIKTLAFSPEGTKLLAVGIMGHQVWDTLSGHALPRNMVSPPSPDMDPQKAVKSLGMNLGKGGTFSPDGSLIVRGHGRLIKISDYRTGEEREPLTGHTSDITALLYSTDGNFLISGAKDGTIRLWDTSTYKEQVALIGIGKEEYVAVTPEQYYRTSPKGRKGLAFRVEGERFPFEQFDLRFNRPDIILERLQGASPQLIQSYKQAYEKRLRKMGLKEEMLGTDWHLPEVQILGKPLPLSVASPQVTLRVKAQDSKYPLDRLKVFVNDIPVHGTTGISLSSTHPGPDGFAVTVPLVPGRNKIQVSVLNGQGTESLKQTRYTNYTAPPTSQDIYILAIGVSQYQNQDYNLRFAAKDAQDLLNAYQQQSLDPESQLHVLALTDTKATRPEILKAKDWLKQSNIHDLVVVFAAGHGMTDDQSNYFFGTHDIDPKNPGIRGLPYEEFEFLLDGIPSLQKVLLLDTCFSGEIDKEEVLTIAPENSTGQSTGVVKMRAFKAHRGIAVVADSEQPDGPAQLSPDLVHFQQDWFADLRRGTGAVVISSSSGNEYSLEGDQWQNGVFTYALLQGLKERKADADGNQIIHVSELQKYVIEQVQTLTNGGQNPTIRRENLTHDFAIY